MVVSDFGGSNWDCTNHCGGCYCLFSILGCLGWGSHCHIFRIGWHQLLLIPLAPQVCHCCFRAAAAYRQIQKALTRNFAARHRSKPAGGSGMRHGVGEILALKLHFNFCHFTLMKKNIGWRISFVFIHLRFFLNKIDGKRSSPPHTHTQRTATTIKLMLTFEISQTSNAGVKN